jgi:hypothetical protein
MTTFRAVALRTVRNAALLALVAASLAIAVPAHAQATLNLLYFFTGIRHGSTATAMTCSNYSGANRQIQFVLMESNGTVRANVSFIVGHPQTVIVTTQATTMHTNEVNLNTASIFGGLGAVLSDHPNIVCTAFLVNPFTGPLAGVSLHGVRFSPVAGTLE